MLDRIQALIAEEYDAKLLLKQAEYKALQAQVNPHFLYNSLDTMAGIAQAGGCPEVGSLCRALSNMFRYAIDAKESLATVRSEIVNVKNYMHIMNVRMNGRIDLDIRVDRSILEEKVPKLCLQPLVEILCSTVSGISTARKSSSSLGRPETKGFSCMWKTMVWA